MNAIVTVDVAGRRRSPAAMPGYHAGRPPRNKGLRYPADPPRVEEIIAVMRHAGPGVHGDRTRALVVVLWRSGLRIAEALALGEADLDERRGALLVRHGKGGKRREVGMDEWGWEQLRPWLTHREQLPVGRLFCVIEGPTRGGRGRPARSAPICSARRRGRRPATVRAAPAPSRARCRDGPRRSPLERDPTPTRPHRPRRHVSVYLQGIDNAEIINTIHNRTAPMMPAGSGLRL